jgi:hypothetical protein
MNDTDHLNLLVYGPIFWKIIHGLTLQTDKANVDDYISFINNLGEIFPCPACRVHYLEYLNSVKGRFDNYRRSNLELFLWSWNFHDDVNQRINKKSIDYSCALRYYQENRIGINEIVFLMSILSTLYDPSQRIHFFYLCVSIYKITRNELTRDICQNFTFITKEELLEIIKNLFSKYSIKPK